MTVAAQRHALTAAHRSAQIAVGAVALQRGHLITAQLLDPARLDQSFGDWAAVMIGMVDQQRRQSAAVAGRYYQSLRALDVAGPVEVDLAGPANPRAVTISLLVSGPISIRRAISRRGVELADAVQTASDRAASEAMRHVLAAGRETIASTTANDPRGRGWRRVASARACAFCRDLAARGIHGGEDAVHFAAHALCSCSAEPAFTAG